MEDEPKKAISETNAATIVAMGFLTREQIVNAQDLKPEEVPVPEWGGKLLVRGLTGTERDAFEAAITERNGKDTKLNMTNIRSRLSASCVVDQAGARMFADADIKVLGAKSGAALDRVFKVASRLSGIGTDDVEELAKGFKPAQSGDSTSV